MTQIQKNILNDEIVTLMETIREQFEALNSFEGKIPILEFEIIKDNVRNLYEKLYVLQRMNDPFDLLHQKEPEVHVAPVPAPPVITEPLVHEPVPPVIIPVPVSEEKEKIPEEVTAPVHEDLPLFNIPVREPEVKVEPSETKAEEINMDLFASETSAFNEKLREAREQSLGPRNRQPGTGDIKSLININEKFLFINELFDGDYKEYTRTIESFNTFSEKSEAFDFLDSLLKDNLWNSGSPAFLKLKEIVEKRFA